MKSFKGWSLVAFTLTILLIVSGCSDSASGDSTREMGDKSGRGSGNGKDKLVIGLDDDPPQLDPHLSSTAVDRQVLHSLFDKLVDIDEDMNIVPKLAKDWDISDDNQTYTFYLQEGVVFHDGTPFNAEAVKFNFDRMLDPAMGSPRYGEVEQVEQVNVIDELTVEVQLKTPFSPFLGDLTDRAGMMLSPTAVKESGEDFSRHPVGTGPYQFVERELQSHIKVSRFDEYWGEPAIIKDVLYKPYTDENIRLTNLISGDVDMITVVGFKDIKKIEGNSAVKLSAKEGRGFLGLHLNPAKAPFNNKDFREAINIAIDRQAITNVVYHGAALPAVSAFPPASWAHNPSLEVPKGDLTKAKSLLEKSGIKDPSFTIKVKPVETDKQMAEMVQSMLQEIGVTVNVEMQEIGSLLSSAIAGDYEALYLGWDGRTDPDGSVSRFFMSNGYNNYAKVNNPEIDKLLTDARVSLDQEERKKIYQRFSEVVFDEANYIFLVHIDENKAMKTNVNGFIHYPDGMIRPDRIYFD
ncbi:ABC transporter substrate-binding protein [Sporosarcina koreensis]|uniref:ABC transporter substrate-binding protein n=1 Tax=Sporosarcina koreensis TaxID=334735 RepID=UPI00075B8E96|nr:ABC transporter substrate-binding protein [Sporosarcina koreensis]